MRSFKTLLRKIKYTTSYLIKSSVEIPSEFRLLKRGKTQHQIFFQNCRSELLNEFNSLTGVPVLLNTSFNIAGEPLVETIDDAIKTFNNSQIDVLWFPEMNKMVYK